MGKMKVRDMSGLPRLSIDKVPGDELSWFFRFLEQNPWLYTPGVALEEFARYGHAVRHGRSLSQVSEIIRRGIESNTPLSIIRVGDGESNFLTYGAYDGLAKTSPLLVDASLKRREDRVLSIPWNYRNLQKLMLDAVLDSDVIGVPYVSKGTPDIKAKRAQQFTRRNPRAFMGLYLGTHYMRRLAMEGALENAVLASMNLGYRVIADLPQLPRPSGGLFAIASKREAIDTLREWLPGIAIHHVPIGNRDTPPKPDPQSLIHEIMAQLPDDLSGALCLVGAGPWSELLCPGIKARGGIGVDVGTSFDLLAGKWTRPAHKRVDTKRLRAGETSVLVGEDEVDD